MNGNLIKGVKNALPFIVKSSKGHRIKTVCGKELMDLTSGIGVTNLGHCHSLVTEAAQEACATLVHAQMNIMRHEPMMNVINNLTRTHLAQKSRIDNWFLWNGGSDAVEGAIKIARMATGKQNIITSNLGYHGRTFMTMGLTASGTIYRSGFGPLPSGIFQTPFPYLSRSPFARRTDNTDDGSCSTCGASGNERFSVEKCPSWGCQPQDVMEKEVKRCLFELEFLLRTQTSPEETACIILEPVLGEGGYVPSPPGYLRGVRDICDKNNILLICDEVQTGFGRTGTLFASEWIGGDCIDDPEMLLIPDIVVCAKGLANGFPLSAVGTRKNIADKQVPGSMGGTYGGNAVACAASNAVFHVLENENILENSMLLASVTRKYLSSVSTMMPGLIREVRGRGLMIGVEFNAFGEDSYFGLESNVPESYGQFASAVAKTCWDHDLIVLSCGPFDTVRLIPPLNISEMDLVECLNVFSKAVKKTAMSFQNQNKRKI